MGNNLFKTNTKSKNEELSSRFFNKGRLEYKREHYLKSLEYLSRSLELSQSNHEAFYLKGVVYLSLNEHEQALECFNRVIKLKPDFVKVYLSKCSALKQLLNYREALDCVLVAKNLHSSNCDIYVNLAHLYCLNKQHQIGLEYFCTEIETCPYNDLAYMSKGLIYTDLSIVQEAARCFRKSISYNAFNELALVNLAYIFCNQSKYYGGLKLINRALKVNKQNQDAYYIKGLIYFRQKHFVRAISNFNRALEVDPANVKVLFALGHLYLYRKQTHKACKLYNKVLDLNTSKDYLILRPVKPIVKAIDWQHYSDALMLCNSELNKNGNNYLVYYLKAIVLNHMNMEQEGYECFNAARELQKQCGLKIDLDLVLFHAYFYIYDKSLIEIWKIRLKINKKKRKKFKDKF